MKHNNAEKILVKTLKLKEEGRSPSEIFDLFPGHKKEVQDFFKVLDILVKEKEKIIPSKELLKEIITKLPREDSVTNKNVNRYLLRGEFKENVINIPNNKTKGRPSIFESLIKEFYMNKKVYAVLGAVLLLAVVAGGVYWQFRTPVSTGNISKTNQEQVKKETENIPIENLDSELALELDSFSSDLNDLESIGNDTALDSLDNSLSGVGE